MTIEERQKILSNDYANAIIEYIRVDGSVERFKNLTRNIIDEKYAVVYFPISEVVTQIVLESGYAVIPKLYGLLDSINLETMGVNRVQNNPQLALFGEGVLLGFVDTGIDYMNPIFKNADNTTRIVSIWDQTIENMEAPENIYYYGTEYSREQINEALLSPEPYKIVPSRDEIGHGTIMAGVAGGGRDEKNNFQGVVPRSEFVVVKLKQAKKNLRDYFGIPDNASCFQSDDIIFGIHYLVNVARQQKKPIVICIGLGTNQGSHDGYDVLSMIITKLGGNTGNAFVIAGGNEANSKNHYFGTIDSTVGNTTVELIIGNNDKVFAMELWGFAPATYSIDILSPSGQYVPRIVARLGESRIIEFLFEQSTVIVDYLVIESQSGEPFIMIRFKNSSPGLWKFRVYARGSENIRFHMWLPISNFISKDTYFVNADADTTITSPGNAVSGITITAYEALSGNIYANASKGYTKNGRIKPDLAAPGVEVLVPIPGNEYFITSGTSIAAAYATGITAMLFEWGIVKGNYYSISSIQVERFLIRGAERDPGITYPNNIWGYGTINIFNTFLSLISLIE